MKGLKRWVIVFLFLLSASAIHAQHNKPLDVARHYLANGQPDSALVVYKIAYEDEPFNQKIYQEYFDLLLLSKKYKEAEVLVKYMQEIRRNDPGIQMDLAQVYELQGDKKSYNKVIEEMLGTVAGMSDYDVRKMASTFQQKGQYNNAIKVYTQAIGQDQRVGRFDKDLMYLYIENNEIEKAIDIFAEIHTFQMGVEQDLKARLLTYIEKDPKNKPQLEKLFKKQADKKKENQAIYVGLLTWLNQQSGAYNDALSNLIALDKKNKGSLVREIFSLGMDAMENRQYTIVAQAMEYIAKTTEEPSFKDAALSVLIRNDYLQLYNTRPVQQPMVEKVRKEMSDFFLLYPAKKTQIEYLWYMDVLGKYAKQPEMAIILLDSMLVNARVSKEYMGVGKLALGDFQLLAGEVWDANLTYAQVDKLFRLDALGDEARFKQAKLAFYRGDFEWAQTQLNVLKASTAQLISNDAMSLSIMITENTVKDSTFVPLEMYAKADLMIFQYQYVEADSILNALIATFPDNDLIDDVYMLKGAMAREEGRFAAAVSYYEIVIDKYKEGVLADDALLKCGEIYEINLGDKEKARICYESLIVDFPNSTLTTLARSKLEQLNKV